MFDRRAGGRGLNFMRTARGRLRGPVALILGAAALVVGVHAAPAPASLPAASHTAFDPHSVMGDPDQARADYVEHCGGCHGIHGDTVPAHLPELEGRVGWFMCTPAARAYLIRLPNVAHSRITDNAELADMMNYVVFVLGEGSAPAGTPPFTADEVARERVHALTNMNLSAERLRLANQLVRQCHAPESIRQLYPGEKR